MKTYTIGNNATMENEVVIIGDYYMERKAYNVIRNDIKENILTQNRIEARKIQKKRDEKCTADREERTYFCNQKLLGIAWILIVLILTVIIGDPVCAALSIFGIGMIFTKKMVIVNDYYWKHGGAEQWKI